MKHVLLCAVLLLAVSIPVFAEDSLTLDLADRDPDFPTVSKIQVRQPISIQRGRGITTQDHDACGSNPSIPYNCTYFCANGVPQHYENGEPILICWYEPDEGGGSGCQAGNQCSSNSTCWSAPIYQGCRIQTYSCSNC